MIFNFYSSLLDLQLIRCYLLLCLVFINPAWSFLITNGITCFNLFSNPATLTLFGNLRTCYRLSHKTNSVKTGPISRGQLVSCLPYYISYSQDILPPSVHFQTKSWWQALPFLFSNFAFKVFTVAKGILEKKDDA